MNSKRSIRFDMILGAWLVAFSLYGMQEAPKPLPPAQEKASFHLADERLTIELVAAEPDVVSPVAIAFDADGRLYVAEMLDYPNAQTSGQIRLLEDRDHNGRYQSAKIFANKLPFPNGVLPWKGGVLVTSAPDIWYLKDVDGDGRADERRILFSGFGEGNQQLRVNGLTWGLENWVYGANGRSEGEIRRPNDSPGKTISIRGHDFRFRPDTLEFEALAGRSQFGLGRDDWGNRFLSWNTIAIRQEVLPERYLSRNARLAATESLADIIEPGDSGRVFPLASPPLTFNNESVKNFNALAGLTIYRGGALGEEYRGNAFVGESLLNLVHRRVLEANGLTFVARRGEREKEFLASTDPWFHPVNFATAPDGALYVVDFYRRFVEHPDFVHGPARNEMPWREGAAHGRIWRIRNSKSQLPTNKVNLSLAGWPELVEHLRDDNGWWRDTAQRLLVERQEHAAIPALEGLVREPAFPLARLHALYALDGLSAITPRTLITALKDPHPGLREHALRLCELFSAKGGPPLRGAIIAATEDLDARVRFQAALTLGELTADAKLAGLIRIARRDLASRWHQLAVLSSTGPHAWPLLKKLTEEEPNWLSAPTSEQAEFLDQLARLVGVAPGESDLKECFTLLSQSATGMAASARLAVLAGLGDGLARSPRPLRQLMSHPPEAFKGQILALSPLIEAAAKRAVSPEEKTSDRLNAIRILARVPPELSRNALPDLLQSQESAQIQSAAARALADLDSPEQAKTIFSRWSRYTAATRRRILASVPRSAALMMALADALEQRSLLSVELDSSVRQALLKTSNDQLKGRFQNLLTTMVAQDRQEVVTRFQPALKLEGDRQKGAVIFSRLCLLCHAVEGQGRHVGPDLSGIASRPKETLLTDILDPSRQVSPDFINYTLTTAGGKVITGFILSETAASVTLRRAGEADDTVLRSEIKELRADGKSLMPEGLEQGLTPKDLADLLAFLQRPEGRLLSETK